jgi:uncharacterized UPF0146 family protein
VEMAAVSVEVGAFDFAKCDTTASGDFGEVDVCTDPQSACVAASPAIYGVQAPTNLYQPAHGPHTEHILASTSRRRQLALV